MRINWIEIFLILCFFYGYFSVEHRGYGIKYWHWCRCYGIWHRFTGCTQCKYSFVYIYGLCITHNTVQHTIPPCPHTFDKLLNLHHFQYLGNLERVSGHSYLEPNRNYNMPIIIHNSLVYPGETLPMILSQHMFLSADFNDDGLIFGLVFRELLSSHNSKLFGVTCQIYEKSNDDSDNISIKSRAYQRFYLKNE